MGEPLHCRGRERWREGLQGEVKRCTAPWIEPRVAALGAVIAMPPPVRYGHWGILRVLQYPRTADKESREAIARSQKQ